MPECQISTVKKATDNFITIRRLEAASARDDTRNNDIEEQTHQSNFGNKFGVF